MINNQTVLMVNIIIQIFCRSILILFEAVDDNPEIDARLCLLRMFCQQRCWIMDPRTAHM